MRREWGEEMIDVGRPGEKGLTGDDRTKYPETSERTCKRPMGPCKGLI